MTLPWDYYESSLWWFVVSGGSLLEGLRLSTQEQDGYDGLCNSGHQSVIPYIHEERELYCCVCGVV
jgi:hypothetical protein